MTACGVMKEDLLLATFASLGVALAAFQASWWRSGDTRVEGWSSRDRYFLTALLIIQRWERAAQCPAVGVGLRGARGTDDLGGIECLGGSPSILVCWRLGRAESPGIRTRGSVSACAHRLVWRWGGIHDPRVGQLSLAADCLATPRDHRVAPRDFLHRIRSPRSTEKESGRIARTIALTPPVQLAMCDHNRRIHVIACDFSL